jgi:hypothetical protein
MAIHADELLSWSCAQGAILKTANAPNTSRPGTLFDHG